MSLHQNVFNELQEDVKINEYLAFGDSKGNLVLYQNREPVFYDSYCYGQVCAIKFLETTLKFAIITSEGQLKIARFARL